MANDLQMLQMMGRIDTETILSATRGRGASAATQTTMRAFETQLRMMNRLFADQDGEQEGAFLHSPMGQDPRMYDALATISRIFAARQAELAAGTTEKPQAAFEASVNPEKIDTAGTLADTGRIKADNTVYEVVEGKLSAVFESGKDGVATIGYDRVGGTSYGTYQIASRTGSMDRFLSYLRTEAPDIASRLDHAGPANTGSKYGSMPRAWKSIAREQPERFEKLQRDFIAKDHYDPARDKILAATGLDVDQAPAAVQEVLWSTAVQHGATGAARIFSRAVGALGDAGEDDFAGLVAQVYDTRKTQFGSSTARVQESVANRLTREKDMALSMLKGGVDQLV